MTGKRHSIISSALVFTGYLAFQPLPVAIIGAASASVGALLPDVDTAKSKAGVKLRKAYPYVLISSISLVVLSLMSSQGFLGPQLKSISRFISDITFYVCMALVFMIAAKNASHRGPTHSLFIPLVLSVLQYLTLGFGNGFLQVVMLGFILGYTLHIVEDLLYGKGCKIFWPVASQNYNILDLKYDGFGEKLIEAASVILALVLFYIKELN